tara:strand:+ start:554 stop:1459 length:906 start_codon:yes stop_codon:yes gene_type:complete
LSKKKLKITFTDFWPNFQSEDNYFYHLLSQKYELELNHKNPDLLIHSVDYSGSEKHKNFDKLNIKKIFYTGEDLLPNFDNTNFSLTFSDNLGAKNFRLPLWVLFINWFNLPYNKKRDPAYLINKKNLTSNKSSTLRNNQFFCSFIASKPSGKRLDFVPKLNDKKKIHCAGRLFNNTYYPLKGRGDHKNKINFMKNFKFNIAFESSKSDGYVTEKILHSMAVNSIPIYWGTHYVKKDFNAEKILFYDDFENDEHLIEDILKINGDKKILKKYQNQPIFEENTIPEKFHPDNVLEFMIKIIEK